MPSVFKYNGNEIIDSSGVVTSTSMPSTVRDRTEWYPIHGGHSYHGAYLTSNNLDEGFAVSSGCAPLGFTSVTAIKIYFIGGSAEPGGWSPIEVRWNIASEDEAHNTHEKTFNVTPSGAFGANKIRALDIYNFNNDGADFEDMISENDVFGIRVTGPNASNFFGALGTKITWRF